jgi:hypothetical protein
VGCLKSILYLCLIIGPRVGPSLEGHGEEKNMVE